MATAVILLLLAMVPVIWISPLLAFALFVLFRFSSKFTPVWIFICMGLVVVAQSDCCVSYSSGTHIYRPDPLLSSRYLLSAYQTSTYTAYEACRLQQSEHVVLLMLTELGLELLVVYEMLLVVALVFQIILPGYSVSRFILVLFILLNGIAVSSALSFSRIYGYDTVPLIFVIGVISMALVSLGDPSRAVCLMSFVMQAVIVYSVDVGIAVYHCEQYKNYQFTKRYIYEVGRCAVYAPGSSTTTGSWTGSILTGLLVFFGLINGTDAQWFGAPTESGFMQMLPNSDLVCFVCFIIFTLSLINAYVGPNKITAYTVRTVCIMMLGSWITYIFTTEFFVSEHIFWQFYRDFVNWIWNMLFGIPYPFASTGIYGAMRSVVSPFTTLTHWFDRLVFCLFLVSYSDMSPKIIAKRVLMFTLLPMSYLALTVNAVLFQTWFQNTYFRIWPTRTLAASIMVFSFFYDPTLMVTMVVRGFCYNGLSRSTYMLQQSYAHYDPEGTLRAFALNARPGYDFVAIGAFLYDMLFWFPSLPITYYELVAYMIIDTCSEPIMFSHMPAILHFIRMPFSFVSLLWSEMVNYRQYDDFEFVDFTSQDNTVIMNISTKVSEPVRSFELSTNINTVSVVYHPVCSGGYMYVRDVARDINHQEVLDNPYYTYRNRVGRYILPVEGMARYTTCVYRCLGIVIMVVIKLAIVSFKNTKLILFTLALFWKLSPVSGFVTDTHSDHPEGILTYEAFIVFTFICVYVALYARMVVRNAINEPIPFFISVAITCLMFYAGFPILIGTIALVTLTNLITYVMQYGDIYISNTDIISVLLIRIGAQITWCLACSFASNPFCAIIQCWGSFKFYVLVLFFGLLLGMVLIVDVYSSDYFAPQEILIKNSATGRVEQRYVRHTLLGSILFGNVIGSRSGAFRQVVDQIQACSINTDCTAMDRFLSSFGGIDGNYSKVASTFIDNAKKLGCLDQLLVSLQDDDKIPDNLYTAPIKNRVPIRSLMVLKHNDKPVANAFAIKTKNGKYIVANVHSTIHPDSFQNFEKGSDDLQFKTELTVANGFGVNVKVVPISFSSKADICLLKPATTTGMDFANIGSMRTGSRYIWMGINPNLTDPTSFFSIPVHVGSAGMVTDAKAEYGDSGSVLVDIPTGKICGMKWGAKATPDGKQLTRINYFVDLGSLLQLNRGIIFNSLGLVDLEKTIVERDYNSFVKLFASASDAMKSDLEAAINDNNLAEIQKLMTSYSKTIQLGKSVLKTITSDMVSKKTQRATDDLVHKQTPAYQELNSSLTKLELEISLLRDTLSKSDESSEDEFIKHLKQQIKDLNSQIDARKKDLKIDTPENLATRREFNVKMAERAKIRKQIEQLVGSRSSDEEIKVYRDQLKALNLALIELEKTRRETIASIEPCRMPSIAERWSYPYWFRRESDGMYVTYLAKDKIVETIRHPSVAPEAVEMAHFMNINVKQFKRLIGSSGVLESWHNTHVEVNDINHWVRRAFGLQTKYESVCPYCAEQRVCDCNKSVCDDKCVKNVEKALTNHLKVCLSNVYKGDTIIVKGYNFDVEEVNHRRLVRCSTAPCNNAEDPHHQCIVNKDQMAELKAGDRKFKHNAYDRLAVPNDPSECYYVHRRCWVAAMANQAFTKPTPTTPTAPTSTNSLGDMPIEDILSSITTTINTELNSKLKCIFDSIDSLSRQTKINHNDINFLVHRDAVSKLVDDKNSSRSRSLTRIDKSPGRSVSMDRGRSKDFKVTTNSYSNVLINSKPMEQRPKRDRTPKRDDRPPASPIRPTNVPTQADGGNHFFTAPRSHPADCGCPLHACSDGCQCHWCTVSTCVWCNKNDHCTEQCDAWSRKCCPDCNTHIENWMDRMFSKDDNRNFCCDNDDTQCIICLQYGHHPLRCPYTRRMSHFCPDSAQFSIPRSIQHNVDGFMKCFNLPGASLLKKGQQAPRSPPRSTQRSFLGRRPSPSSNGSHHQNG